MEFWGGNEVAGWTWEVHCRRGLEVAGTENMPELEVLRRGIGLFGFDVGVQTMEP